MRRGTSPRPTPSKPRRRSPCGSPDRGLASRGSTETPTLATIRPYGDKAPKLHGSVFAVESAVVVGDVIIGEDASLSLPAR